VTPEELLRAVRRRVRLHRATAALLGGGWLAALACVAVVASARALPWSFVEPAGIVVPAVLLAARVAWTATRPVPDVVAARAADEGLRSRDALSAHVEFGEAGDPTFAARIAARAHAVAAAADPRGAVPRPPVPWSGSRPAPSRSAPSRRPLARRSWPRRRQPSASSRHPLRRDWPGWCPSWL